MASQSAQRSTDTERGIQNVQKRVAELPSRQNIGDRYKGMGWNKTANDEAVQQAANDELIQQAENEEAVTLAYIAEEEAVQQQELEAEQFRIQQIKERGSALKTALEAKDMVTRGTLLTTSLWVACTAYMFQLPFAVFSLAAFIIHGKLLETRDTTWYGKLLGLVVDFPNKLPFELIGYLCWGVVFVITFGVFFSYIFSFQSRGISIVSSGGIAIFVTAVCLGLNIFPGTNIFPFLLVWVIYMCVFGKIKKMGGLRGTLT